MKAIYAEARAKARRNSLVEKQLILGERLGNSQIENYSIQTRNFWKEVALGLAMLLIVSIILVVLLETNNKRDVFFKFYFCGAPFAFLIVAWRYFSGVLEGRISILKKRLQGM